MENNFGIDFYDPDAPKQDTPYERKRKQVINNIADVLRAHPPCSAPFILEKLAVFGSRTLKDDRVLEIIGRYFDATNARVIVTAFEPEGICAMAQKFCRANKHPLQIHYLNIGKYARGAHEHRSDEVILASDATLFIHDGKSRGTYNEILRAIKFKKPYFYEFLPELKDDGFFCDVG